MRVSWSWKNWSPAFHAARGTFISEVWRLSRRGRRPRVDIQTKAGSQTKEMKVPLKAWKVGLKVFNSWKHSNDALGILFFWGRGLNFRLDLGLRSELQHCKNSLKVSRSSTENSRPKACYFPKSEARGQNWPLRLPSYTTSIKNHYNIHHINPTSLIFHPSSDCVVVRVLDSHAAAPGSIPGSVNETLSKFPKFLFLIEEQLSMLKFIMKWLSVIYYDHFPSPGDGFSSLFVLLYQPNWNHS